jgi:hypothetical protein
VPLSPADAAPSLEPATLEVSGAASVALEGFRAEFTADDAPFSAATLRAEAAASSVLAGLDADARQTGLARLGLAASDDARKAASVLLATLIARESPHDASAVHEAIDPGGDAVVDLGSQSMLVPVALGHAWLVASRPFFLGNARTARAILSAQLGSPEAPLPISGGLLSDAAAYRSAIDDYARGDANPIVLVVARAIHAAVDNARELATALAITRDDWDHAMVGVRSHAASRELVSVAFENPVVDAKLVVPALGVTLAAAYTSIETLVERGILEARGAERRNRAWYAPAILDAIDAFVERARA